MKKIVLLLSWRDIFHPDAGGAEIFTTKMLELMPSLANHRWVHFSCATGSQEGNPVRSGIQYIRKGNFLTVLFYALAFYLKNRKNIVMVVDQCNTHRFFTPLWVPQNKRVFFIHQLTREIWYVKWRRPFSSFGYWAENWLLKLYKRTTTITVSKSTEEDLIRIGFSPQNIHILPEGLDHTPISTRSLKTPKNTSPTLSNHKCLMPMVQKPLFLYVGRYAQYKGINDAIEAYGRLCQDGYEAQLVLVGKRNTKYVEKVLKPICIKYGLTWSSNYSPHQTKTVFSVGRVTETLKHNYMQRATALVYPSIREGWGLGVSEAAVLGTPSVVYNAPGLRDAVNRGNAGYICNENSVEGLKEKLIDILSNQKRYQIIREQAYHFSKNLKWDLTAQSFYTFAQLFTNKSKEHQISQHQYLQTKQENRGDLHNAS